MIGGNELARIELAIASTGVEEAAAIAFAAIARLGQLKGAKQALDDAVALAAFTPDALNDYERGWSVVVG